MGLSGWKLLAGLSVVGWWLLIKLLETEQKPKVRIDDEELDGEHVEQREKEDDVDVEEEEEDDDEDEGDAIIRRMNAAIDDKEKQQRSSVIMSKQCQDKAWERAENDFR